MTDREKCPNTEVFCSVFSRIRTKYGEILRISPYSVRIRENTEQKNLRIWTIFRQFLVESSEVKDSNNPVNSEDSEVIESEDDAAEVMFYPWQTIGKKLPKLRLNSVSMMRLKCLSGCVIKRTYPYQKKTMFTEK